MSAMLDTYDTQMLDYHPHDLDVQMNTAVGSDSWVQEEATMEDDGFTHKSTFENVSIEIDMDDYDGISAESDMSKDLQGIYEDGNADIVDVEVYDTSQLHSPAVFPHPIPEETPELANAGQNNDLDIFPTVRKEQLDDHIGLPSDILDHLPTEHTAEVLTTDKAELVGSADIVNSQVESNVLTEVDSHVVPTSDQGIDEANAPWTSSADDPADSSSNGLHENTEATDADTAAPVVEVPEDKETGHIQEHYPQDTDHQDPHEISEGVYIDPPPPVLLTVDIIGHYDINLFNEVLDVGTMEDGEGEQDDNPRIVLLQDRPTLYYETLSNFFDALRQDTFLTNLTEISEGELVLEAYDLRLVMPEDNCYVRGISLHEINMLHDSYGLSGPLRLRLRLESPRFIILYQRLQDRTAQLSTETHTDANTLNEQAFQGESGHEDQDSAELGKAGEEAPHVSNSDDGATNTLPEDYEVEGSGDQEPVAQKAPSLDGDSVLQYADRAEPDVGTAAAESEATCTASERKRTASKVMDAASDASAKDGEVSNSEANQDRTTGDTTPRLPSPSASEEKDELETAVIAGGGEDGDSSRPEENDVPQNVDSAAPLMEQSVLDANSASDSHELSQSELAEEHERAPSEEHDVTEETVDPDFFGSESWDAQFGEDGDLDAAWDYETDKDEDEEERDGQDSASVESSVTLSSKLSSKRSFHELDEDEDDLPSHSPGLKKPRME